MTSRSRKTPEGIILPRWLRLWIYTATMMLSLSGIIWLVAHFFLRKNGNMGDITHPLEPWMLRIHGFAVMLGLFLYGTLLRSHVIKGWNAGKNRLTGIFLASLLLLLTLSGYLLYYASSEELRPIISAAHWVIGLTLIVIMPLHIWKGRQKRKYRPGAKQKP